MEDKSSSVQGTPEQTGQNTSEQSGQDTSRQSGQDTSEQSGQDTSRQSGQDTSEQTPKKKKISDTVINWVLINVGTLLVAAGVYFFKVPNSFATGGVSGISIILSRLFSHYAPTIITQANINMAVNVILLIFGFIFLGKGCTFKTAYCSIVYSLENLLFEILLPFPKDASGQLIPLTNQPLMELVYAMLLTGIGSAIIFNCHASSGGTDIIALILKKYTTLNTGKALLITDFAIAFSTFFVTGSTQAGLFSILGLFAKAFIIDGVIESIGKSKYITIITTNPDVIGRHITENMKRDYTAYKATGGYTGNEKTVIITVCKRSEAVRLKAKVKELDPHAFTIITDANEILGKGFRQ